MEHLWNIGTSLEHSMHNPSPHLDVHVSVAAAVHILNCLLYPQPAPDDHLSTQLWQLRHRAGVLGHDRNSVQARAPDHGAAVLHGELKLCCEQGVQGRVGDRR